MGILAASINHSDFQPNVFTGADPFLNALMSCDGGKKIMKMNMKKWATASPRFIVPDNMLLDAIERARRDVRKVRDREWNLWNTGTFTHHPNSCLLLFPSSLQTRWLSHCLRWDQRTHSPSPRHRLLRCPTPRMCSSLPVGGSLTISCKQMKVVGGIGNFRTLSSTTTIQTVSKSWWMCYPTLTWRMWWKFPKCSSATSKHYLATTRPNSGQWQDGVTTW